MALLASLQDFVGQAFPPVAGGEDFNFMEPGIAFRFQRGTQTGQVDIAQDSGALFNVRGGTNLADVVKALNALGAKPMDLVSILQAMKAAGALRADLEII